MIISALIVKEKLEFGIALILGVIIFQETALCWCLQKTQEILMKEYKKSKNNKWLKIFGLQLINMQEWGEISLKELIGLEIWTSIKQEEWLMNKFSILKIMFQIT